MTTTVPTNYKYAQQVEFAALIYVSYHMSGPCNVVSDSVYMVRLFSGIVTASLNAHNHVFQDLLLQLQALLPKYAEINFIIHI